MNESLNCSTEAIGTPNYGVLTLSLFVIGGIMGNSLVCLSIAFEKQLQNATNYFLVSLAVCDLMVSVFVMPFSVMHEYSNGFWAYGFSGCLLYTSLDVFLCSLSMWHMTVIAVDRHKGISHPFKARNKTKKEVYLKIALIWGIAFIISSPITIIGLENPRNIWSECICGIFPNYNIAMFQIYGTILSFLIPSVILIVTFMRTSALLKKQMKMVGGTCPELRRNTGRSRSNSGCRDPFSSRRTSAMCVAEQTQTHVSPVVAMQQIHRLYSEIIVQRNMLEEQRKRKYSARFMYAKPSVRNDMKRAATLYYLKSRKDSAVIVNREQKATQVLGVVFFSFFLCWSPFFTTNLILAICGENCAAFPGIVAKIFLWLGYISSVINPVIYTAFNKTFRITFWRLLCCGYCFKKSRYTKNACNPRTLPELTANNSFDRVRYSLIRPKVQKTQVVPRKARSTASQVSLTKLKSRFRSVTFTQSIYKKNPPAKKESLNELFDLQTSPEKPRKSIQVTDTCTLDMETCQHCKAMESQPLNGQSSSNHKETTYVDENNSGDEDPKRWDSLL